MERYFVSPHLAALQSACLAASKDNAAKASVWGEVVSAFAAVTTAEAEALCPILRSVISKSDASYKTLSQSVSTAFRAIRSKFPLRNKYGPAIGRTEIERQCQIVDANAREKAKGMGSELR